MSSSLRTRLFLVQALVLFASLAAVALLVSFQMRGWLAGEHAAALERIARVAASAIQREPPPEAAWPETAASLARDIGSRVTVIAQDGRVLGDSDVPPERLAALPNHGDREEVRAALAGHVGRAQRRSATLGIDLLYVAVPMHAGAAAVLRLAESPAILAARRNAILLLSLLAASVALGLSGLAVFWATGRHARRIRELEAATLRLGDETPAGRAHETPADELGRLGRAINRMAEERRTRLDALVRERDERERMLAHLSDGVALLDGEGRVLRCNHSLAEILGVPEPAAEGTPFQSFARVPELEALAQSARAGGHAVEDDVRIWTPHPRLVHASAIPLGDSGRGALLLVLRDLSEVEASSRVRQDFVANVSHELRTPLTSLRGYAETLLEGGSDDAEHREGFVRVIRDSAVRLEALVEDLLSLASSSAPARPRGARPWTCELLAERQAELWRPVAARAGAGVRAGARATAARSRRSLRASSRCSRT